MKNIPAVISDYLKTPIAVYGLGNETKKFLLEWGNNFSIVGLLDGYLEAGEMYGYPVLSMQKVIDSKVSMILVIARPGSCKAIARRISALCMENGIVLLDIRGNNLLVTESLSCGFNYEYEKSKEALNCKMRKAEVVSFDLFDTLVMRKVYDYTDVFVLIDLKLRRRGIIIPEFTKVRLFAEKELSRTSVPTLEEIYARVLEIIGGGFITAETLAEMEWQIDSETFVPRESVCAVFHSCIAQGKEGAVVTDTYYRKDQIVELLERFGLVGYDYLLVSCEVREVKSKGLFDSLKSACVGRKILHIGDDEVADIEGAAATGIDAFKIYSSHSLFDMLSGVNYVGESISEHIAIGLFIARLLNNPFQFEPDKKSLAVSSAKDIGYSFFAPIISAFVLWLNEKIHGENYEQILFCSRDGYLIGDLYRRIDKKTRSIYFLTSRMAAIRAGIENEADISDINSMKYFGTKEEELKVRFGVSKSNDTSGLDSNDIIDKARIQRENYCKYISKLGMTDKKTALFDFVAKGTVQLYLQRILKRNMQGFYFMQLEPDSMKSKNVEVEPFYTDLEKDKSVMFDNYYILEIIITSPYAQVLEFDKMGNPVFAAETRTAEDIKCICEVQSGITDFFEDYISLLPKEAWTASNRLGETLLALINHVEIGSEEFMSLKVEDPFFGRMTNICDVIGN